VGSGCDNRARVLRRPDVHGLGVKKIKNRGDSVSSATSGTFDDCFVEKSVAASFDLKSQNPISILFLPLNHPINI